MNIEFNKRLSAESDPRRRKFIAHIARGIKKKIDSILSEDPEHSVGTPLYQESLTELAEKLKALLPELGEEIESMVVLIVESEFTDNESFANSAAETLVDYTLKHFNYSEIEQIARRDRNMLNRLVEYEVDDDVVRLHIPMLIPDKDIELKSLFIDALRELAKRLKTEPDLQTVKRIDAESWMIYRSPDRVLEMIGFSNIKRDDKEAIGSAEITREVLLEKYSDSLT